MKKVKSTLSVGKRIILLSLCMTMFSVAGFSQGTKGKKVKGAPVFLQAVYQGNDQVYNENPLQAGEFYNPILQGCYPDPSITRKGMITSWCVHRSPCSPVCLSSIQRI